MIDIEASPPRVIDEVVVGDGPEGLAISLTGGYAERPRSGNSGRITPIEEGAMGYTGLFGAPSLKIGKGSNFADRSQSGERPVAADWLKKSVLKELRRRIGGRGMAAAIGIGPHIAGIGAGTGIGLASLRRFWAVAARWNS